MKNIVTSLLAFSLSGILAFILFGVLGYTFGYDFGDSTAYEASYRIATQQTFDINEDIGYDEGFQIGYQESFESGSSDGYQKGYSDGYRDSVQENTTTGYEEGYTDGYDRGYNEGLEIGEISVDENALQIATNSGFEQGYGEGINASNQNEYRRGYQEGLSDGTTEGYNEGYNDGRINGSENSQKILIENLLYFNAPKIRQLMIDNGAVCTTNICEIKTYTSPDGTKIEWRKYDFQSQSFYAYTEFLSTNGEKYKQKVEINLIEGLVLAEWRPINDSFIDSFLIYDKISNTMLKNITSESNTEQIKWLNDWTLTMEDYIRELGLDWLVYSRRN